MSKIDISDSIYLHLSKGTKEHIQLSSILKVRKPQKLTPAEEYIAGIKLPTAEYS